MFSRFVLILMVLVAQLAGAGTPGAAFAPEVNACGDVASRTRAMCCGEGCQCTPDSCPCARPAEPAEHVPIEAPTPGPTQRIDLHHAHALVTVDVVASRLPVRTTPAHAFASSLPRASFRAALGVWTT
jgi:hypothetical protein